MQYGRGTIRMRALAGVTASFMIVESEMRVVCFIRSMRVAVCGVW